MSKEPALIADSITGTFVYRIIEVGQSALVNWELDAKKRFHLAFIVCRECQKKKAEAEKQKHEMG